MRNNNGFVRVRRRSKNSVLCLQLMKFCHDYDDARSEVKKGREDDDDVIGSRPLNMQIEAP